MPDFLIIGVARAGTTTIYDYLANHKEVKRPTTKETVPFDELRYEYNSEKDAKAKIKMAFDNQFHDYMPNLLSQAKLFDESVFHEKFLHLISKYGKK